MLSRSSQLGARCSGRCTPGTRRHQTGGSCEEENAGRFRMQEFCPLRTRFCRDKAMAVSLPRRWLLGVARSWHRRAEWHLRQVAQGLASLTPSVFMVVHPCVQLLKQARLQKSHLKTTRTHCVLARERSQSEKATYTPQDASSATFRKRRKCGDSKRAGVVGRGWGQEEHRGLSGQWDFSLGRANGGRGSLHFVQTRECAPPRGSPSVSYGPWVTENPS